ncbi:MAG: hypothetical protein ABI780_01545 [Ardenticatenales bacterium]
MPARRVLAPVFLALSIGLLAASGTPAAAPFSAAAVRAQAAPEVVVPLYGTTLTFHTVPLTAVNAELADATGKKKDEGIGVARADGVANVQFVLSGEGIQPGDMLTLSRSGGKPLHIAVPALHAAADTEGDRITGHAAPGASVDIALTLGSATPTTIQRTVTADAAGAFALDLAGEADLKAGAVDGTAGYTNADNQRFEVSFSSLGATLTLGAYTLRGRANAGTNVTAEIRHADGTTQTLGPTTTTGAGAFAMSLFGPGQQARPIAAGDAVTIRTVGDPVQNEERTATLTPLSVAIDPSTDTISGSAAADSAVRLLADDMDGQQAAFDAASDGAGMFSVVTAGQADLGAGWRVRAVVDAAPGLREQAVAVIRRVRIGVRFPGGQGRAEPGQAVTVTLRSSAGAVKFRQPNYVNDQGDYNLFGGGGPGGVAPEPGDSVEIAFVDGDPDVLRVPEISARTDVDADKIYGTAPAGATVIVRVNTAGGAKTVTAVSNASGQYEALLSPTVDLVRPMNGSVFVSPTEGAQFYTTWAAIQLTVNGGNSFNSNFVTGNGPTLRTIRAEAYTPDGKLIGQASGTVFGDNAFLVVPGGGANPQFILQLNDTTGARIEMKPGDKLKVTAGDDVIELTIPPLDAVVFVQTDTVNGHTLPNAPVTLQIAGDPTGGIAVSADTTADAAGNFSHSFAGAWDVKYGDFVLLSTRVGGGHQVLNTTIAPGMLVDADQGFVLSSLAPNVEAIVSLKRGGKTVASQATRTDESGGLMAALTDAGGAPITLQTGDVLAVTAASPGVEPLTLTMPDLTVEADTATDAISGRATAGGSMTMLGLDAYSRAGTIGLYQAWPSVEANSTYRADFVPHIDVRPGTSVLALYRPAAGHYVVRTRTVPILNAEHSGPNACGYGEPRKDVGIDVADGMSGHAADAATKARFDGYFSTTLRNAAKSLYATKENDTEMAKLGGPTADVRFVALDVQVDWQQRRITGRGPAATTFFVRPAVPCAQQAPQGVLNVNVQFANPQTTGADGSFQTFLPGQIGQPGTGLELAYYAPNEHRVFRTIYRALAQVYIHADRVSGRANALDGVTVMVAAADGTERARATVKADGDGAYDARLTDAAGKALTIQPGDVVTVQTATESPKVTIEPLAFDWSPGVSEIVGSAPAGRTVDLVLRVTGGRTYTIPLTVDAGGTFRFGATDVPPRAAWSMADVTGVRIVLPTAGGHQIIDQTADFDAPPGPGPDEHDGRTVYLPIGYSNRRAAAVQANGADAPARRVDPVRRVDPDAAQRAWGMVTAPLLRDARGDWGLVEAGDVR